jgi:hypothetical protein
LLEIGVVLPTRPPWQTLQSFGDTPTAWFQVTVLVVYTVPKGAPFEWQYRFEQVPFWLYT